VSLAGWEPIAGDTRGSVTALARAASNVVVATTPVGVYLSMDAGGSWEFSAGGAFAEAVAFSGNDLYVGAADGLHHSADDGRTWEHVLAASRVAAVAAGAGIVLAGTETDGVLCSEDSGRHWSGVNAGLLDLEVLAVCLSPRFTSDRLAFVGTASGLYRSRNGGDSWRAVETGIEEPAVQCVGLGPDRLVVAGTEADGLLCSEDGGTNWDQPVELAERSVTAVAISARGNIAAATDLGLFVSADGGQSWTLQMGGPDAILALLYLEDDVLLVGAERTGAWRLEERTWSESSNGLHASLLSSLVLGADDSLWVAGASEGIRVLRAGAWQQCNLLPPDAAALGFTVAADGTVFTATPEGMYVSRAGNCHLAYAAPVRAVSGSKRVVALAERLIASDDLGNTWCTLPTPFDLRSVIALAAGENALHIATRGTSEMILWRSDHSGAHWHRALLDSSLSALAVAPDGSLWVATATGILVSHDGGATFTAEGGPERVLAIAPPYALELGGRIWRRRDSG
jgi:photosystem II stability/assembly factor-like uncharacterized protein